MFMIQLCAMFTLLLSNFISHSDFFFCGPHEQVKPVTILVVSHFFSFAMEFV